MHSITAQNKLVFVGTQHARQEGTYKKTKTQTSRLLAGTDIANYL